MMNSIGGNQDDSRSCKKEFCQQLFMMFLSGASDDNRCLCWLRRTMPPVKQTFRLLQHVLYGACGFSIRHPKMPVRGDRSSGTSCCLSFSAQSLSICRWRCHNGTFQTTLAMQVPSVHASPTDKPDLQHSAELHPSGFRHVSDGNGSGMHIASGGMGTR